jgi:hypothetical protein
MYLKKMRNKQSWEIPRRFLAIWLTREFDVELVQKYQKGSQACRD